MKLPQLLLDRLPSLGEKIPPLVEHLAGSLALFRAHLREAIPALRHPFTVTGRHPPHSIELPPNPLLCLRWHALEAGVIGQRLLLFFGRERGDTLQASPHLLTPVATHLLAKRCLLIGCHSIEPVEVLPYPRLNLLRQSHGPLVTGKE